ncbi:MAG: AbrB/MazE/SpoVT family DNA-binding domain-containing protein [Halobacteria archaeon]|nr:AbrB/MazE/SpoVT family DNA-binding domain-containing protein [Halobacteria archaeon]
MGEIRVDDRGRITIPQHLRKKLHIKEGDTLKIEVMNGEIRLRVKREDLKTVERDEEWSEEAFVDAGEATFGDG